MEISGINSISTRYSKGKSYFQQRIQSGNIPDCSPGYVRGRCSNGHKFASIQFCGREYCSDCSRDGSPIHQRRVSRGMAWISPWMSVGYLVITIPEGFRRFFFDKAVLKDFRFKLLRKLKEDFHINKGMARWHWFGDCPICKGNGCKQCRGTGAGSEYYPHLNILFQGNYINDVQEYFKPIRIWMHRYFMKLIDQELKLVRNDVMDDIPGSCDQLDFLLDIRNSCTVERLVINYSYTDQESKMMNLIKYVTRATFRILDTEVKELLHNFRNIIKWGWKKGETKVDDDHSVLCPVCSQNNIQSEISWISIEKFKQNTFINHDKQTGIIRIRSGTEITGTGKDRGNPKIDRSRGIYVQIFHKSIKAEISASPAASADHWHRIRKASRV